VLSWKLPKQLIKIFSYLNFTPVSELHRQFNHVFLERAVDVYYDKKKFYEFYPSLWKFRDD